jgi:hypothetical protein
MELDRTTLIFLGFLVIVFLGSVVLKESFVDASGTDISGGFVQVSIKDLLSLLSMQSSPSQPTQAVATAAPVIVSNAEMPKDNLASVTGVSAETDASMYDTAFKTDLLKEVRASVRDELQKKQEGSVLSDSCIDSVAKQQGTDWMRYIPGKNPADYIRKDSIPCYGCNLA